MTNPIRVLVVDDSIFMQMAIRTMLKADSDIEVVGEAVDGERAIEMAERLKPDVITMDVAMPVLDGLEATRQIMAKAPAPIIMLSSLTEKGVVTTFQALEFGAVDYVAKSSSAIDVDLSTIAEQVAGKIRFWGHRKAGSALDRGVQLPAVPRDTDLLVASAGHGGAPLIGELMRAVKTLPFPALVVQDMEPNFTRPFAQYLGRVSGHPAAEGLHQTKLLPGSITVVPGGRSGTVSHDDSGFTLELNGADRGNGETAILSAVAAAQSPLLVLFAGPHEPVLGQLPKAWGPKGGAVWISRASATSTQEALPQVGNADVRELEQGDLVAAMSEMAARAA